MIDPDCASRDLVPHGNIQGVRKVGAPFRPVLPMEPKRRSPTLGELQDPSARPFVQLALLE